MAQAVRSGTGSGQPIRSAPPAKAPFFVGFYRSAIGKKYVMAVTGIVFMLYVFLHMFGNLKMYMGPASTTTTRSTCRQILYPILPIERVPLALPDGAASCA